MKTLSRTCGLGTDLSSLSQLSSNDCSRNPQVEMSTCLLPDVNPVHSNERVCRILRFQGREGLQRLYLLKVIGMSRSHGCRQLVSAGTQQVLISVLGHMWHMTRRQGGFLQLLGDHGNRGLSHQLHCSFLAYPRIKTQHAYASKYPVLPDTDRE